MDPKFSRERFVEGNADLLATELAATLTSRVADATNRDQVVAEILRELRELGHELYSWDRGDDYETWGDDYVHVKDRHRIIISFYSGDDDPKGVEVMFGPWPTGK